MPRINPQPINISDNPIEAAWGRFRKLSMLEKTVISLSAAILGITTMAVSSFFIPLVLVPVATLGVYFSVLYLIPYAIDIIKKHLR